MTPEVKKSRPDMKKATNSTDTQVDMEMHSDRNSTQFLSHAGKRINFITFFEEFKLVTALYG